MKQIFLILSLFLSFSHLNAQLIGTTTKLSSVSLDDNTTEDSENVSAAYSSTTDIHIVVWDGDDVANQLGIYGQLVVSTDGTESGPDDLAIAASTVDEDHTAPSVVYNATSDEFLVVWSAFIDQSGSPAYKIYAQRVSSAGVIQGSRVEVATSGASLENPDVAYNSTEDEYLVTYLSGNEVMGILLVGATAATSGSAFQVNDTNGLATKQYPKVTWNSSDNQYLVVWLSDATPTVGAVEVLGKRLDNTGADVGSETEISTVGDTDTSTDAVNVELVYNADDNDFLVVYNADVVVSQFRTYGAILNNDLSSSVSQFAISSNSDADSPNVIYNSLVGRYYVSFIDVVGTDREVYGQSITTAGALDGTNFELIVNGAGDSDGLEASITTLGMSSGRLASFLVASSGERIADENEVYGQLWGIAENNVSITRTDASPSGLGTVNFTVDFDLSVTGVTTSNFTIVDSGLGAGFGSITGSGTSWNVPITTGSGEGTIGLNYTSNSGISIAVDNSPHTGEVYNIDLTAPTLSSSVPTDGSSTFYLSQDIVLTFDDDMAIGTGNISILDSGDNLIENVDVTNGSLVSISSNEVTIDPTTNLSRAISYYIQVPNTAFTNVTSAAYAGFVDNTTLNFSTVNVVINEIVLEPQTDWSTNAFDGTDGASTVDLNDDWVELYVLSTGIDLTSWTIEVDNDNDGVDLTGDLEAAGAFDISDYISGGSGTYASTESGDYIVLGNPGGSVDMANPVKISLRDQGGAIVDEVIIGTGGFTSYVSSTGTGDESAFRQPNGFDTDTDNSDFSQGTATLGSFNVGNTAPTASAGSVTEDEDTDVVFLVGDFNFSDVDGGDVLSQVNIVTTSTVGVLYNDAANPGVVDGLETLGDASSISAIDIANGQLKFKPVTEASGNSYDSFTFEVVDTNGPSPSLSSYTMTININEVNDEPTLSANSDSPTFTEGDGSPAGLFNTAAANTNDASQDFQLLELTVSNVTDANLEFINIDGTKIELTDTEMGSTTDNSFTYLVGVVINTATLTLSGGLVDAATLQTIVDNLSYQNDSQNPTAGNRLVTITRLQDDGGTSFGGDEEVTLSIASTVNVVAINDDPTLVSIPASILVEEDVAGDVDLSAAIFDDVDSGSENVVLTLTVGAGSLTASTTPGITVGGTSTSLTLTGMVSDIDTYLNTPSNIQYTSALDANGTPATTITIVANDQGNSGTLGGSDVNYGTVNINITAINDEPSIINFNVGNADNQTNNSDEGSISIPLFIDPASDITFGPIDEQLTTPQTVFDFVVVETPASDVVSNVAIANNGTLTYDIAPQTQGTATISVQVQDNGGTTGTNADDLSQIVTFTINVTDNEAPAIASSTPSDGDTDVVATNTIQIVFDENVNRGIGNIEIRDSNNAGALFSSMDVTNTDSVVIASATVDITFPDYMIKEGTYYILVDNGAFTDVNAGNAFGIANTSTFDFDMQENGDSGPNFLYSIPADGGSSVGIDQEIILVFDETMDLGQNTSNGLTLTIIEDPDGASATFAAIQPEDVLTNAANRTIANNIVNINLQDLGYGLLSAGNTLYSFTIQSGAFEDASGATSGLIPSAGDIRFNTVFDATPPVLSAITPFNPVDDAPSLDPAAITSLVVNFDEASGAVLAGTGNIQLYIDLASDALVFDVAASDPAISISGNEVTIDVSGTGLDITFAGQQTYYVNIDADAIEDATGNAFTGIGDNSTWNFTTSDDVIAPTVSSLFPADNSAEVTIDLVGTPLQITFSEPVQSSIGSIHLYTSGSDVLVESILASETTISGVTASFNTTAPLSGFSDYYIKIDNDAFTDSNTVPLAYEGITSKTRWNFKTTATGDNTPPIADYSTVNPSDNGAGLLDPSFTLSFSETIVGISGLIQLFDNTAALIATWDIETDVIVGGDEISFDLSTATSGPTELVYNTGYYFNYDAGILEDQVGNPVAALSSNSDWNFIVQFTQVTGSDDVICTENVYVTLDPITIAEVNTDDFSVGDDQTIILNLPAQFEFDPSEGVIGVIGDPSVDVSSAGNGLSVSAGTLTLVYDVAANSGTSAITITGLSVRYTGITVATFDAIMDASSTALMFGNDETDGQVYMSFTTSATPSIPNAELSSDEVTSFSVSPGGSFTLTGAGGSTNYNWYDDIGNVVTQPTADATDLSGLAGFDINTVDVYTISLTTDDGTCESEAQEILIGVLDIENSEGTTSFTVDSDPTTLTASEPIGWSGIFSGPGLGPTTDGAGLTREVEFDPASATSVGSPHTVSYILTNDADPTIEFQIDQQFIVSDATSSFLVLTGTSTGVDLDYCSDGNSIVFDISSTALTNVELSGFRVSRLQGIGIAQPGSYIDGDGAPADGLVDDHATTVGWTFDPTGVGGIVSETSVVVRLFGIPLGGKTLANGGVESLLGAIEFTVYPEPTANFSGISPFYCEDDDFFTIQGRTIDVVNGTQSGDITTGYVLYKDNGGFAIYEDFTGISNDFDPQDPDQDGITTENETGTYRIEWTTEQLTPGNCTTTVTSSDFEIRKKETGPRLDMTTGLADYGGFDDSQYVFEFCSGTLVPDFTINTSLTGSDTRSLSINNAYNWYEDGATITDGNLVFSTFNSQNLFGGTNTPSGDIEFDFYVTRTVNSCESDSVLITIRVYPDQEQPTFDPADVNVYEEGSDYRLEYCGEISEAIDLAILNIENSSEIGDDRLYVQARSYYNLYLADTGGDPLMTPADIILYDAGIEGDAGQFYSIDLDNNVTINALNQASSTEGATVTTVFFLSKVLADSSYLDGAAPFQGCESALTKVTANIHTDPTVLTVYEMEDAYDDGGVSTYYMCSGDDLSNIETPGVPELIYKWYPDNGTGIAPNYGAEITVDGNDGRFATQTDLEAANGDDFDVAGIYEFWVTQTISSDTEGTGFIGCESDPLKVVVESFADPSAITFDANSLTDYEVSFCEQAISGSTFELTGLANAHFQYYISDVSGNIQSSDNALFNGVADVDGLITIQTEDLLLQNATEAGGVKYFLISQTNNISPNGTVNEFGESYEGCESELIDMAYLTVNIYDIPDAPTTSSGIELYGEDEVDASGITVEGETNVGEVFNWYEDLDEDDLPDGAAIFQGDMATSADLGLLGNIGNGRYKFLVTQTQDINAGVTGFEGCESDYLEIYVFEVPSDPVVTDPSAQCDVSVTNTSTVITHSGIENFYGVSSFLWYAEDADLTEQEERNSSDPDLDNEFTIDAIEDLVFIDGFVGDTTVYVSQLINKDVNINGEVFAGTESGKSEVIITIYPQPISPDVSGNGSVINEYDFCEQLSDPSTELISISSINPGAQYVWYFDQDLADPIDTAASITLAQINDKFLAGGYFNIADDIDQEEVYGIYVTEVNSIIGGFDGCESDPTEILIYKQPKAGDFQFVDKDNFDATIFDGDGFCYDHGIINIGTDILIDGVIEEDAQGTYVINTGGLTDNLDGTATINTADMAAAAGTDREGVSTAHIISFTYTSEWGCVETFNQTININAHPTLDIQYQSTTGQNSFGTAIDGTGVCFEQGEFTLKGIEEGSDASSGIFELFFGMTPIPGGNGFTDLGNGIARVTPNDIMESGVVGETSEGNPQDFIVRFTFDDDNNCQNVIEQTFTIEPQPTLDVIYDQEIVGFSAIGDPLDASIVCYDEGSITIGGTAFHIVEGLEPITSSGSDSISYSISTGGLVDNGNGTATISLASAALAFSNTNGTQTGLPTSHTVTLFYTDDNGCDNSIDQTFTINPQPRLGIAIPDKTPCFDDGVMTLQGLQESGPEVVLTNAAAGIFSIYTDSGVSTPLTTTGFDGDNDDGTASFDPVQIALDFGATKTGDVSKVYILFEYNDPTTGCSNSTIDSVSIQPLPDISFQIGRGDDVLLSEDLLADNYYVSVNETNLDLSAWSFDADDGAGGPLTSNSTSFAGGSIGATTVGETKFDPDGQGAKLDPYSAAESFNVTLSYSDDESCSNEVSKAITVLPIPEFYDYNLGVGSESNILSVQACRSQQIVQEVIINNLDELGATIDDINFTWVATTSSNQVKDITKDFVFNIIKEGSKATIMFDNSESELVLDNDSYPNLDGNVTFEVTASYEFNTGLAQGVVVNESTSVTELIGVGFTPSPRFRWDRTTVGNTATFEMSDADNSPVNINDIAFEVYNANDLSTRIDSIGRNALLQLEYTPQNIKEDWIYTFPSAGTYVVQVTYNSTSSCNAFEERYVTINDLHVISANEIIVHDFEQGTEGWYLDSIDYLSNKPGFSVYDELSQPSWEIGTTNVFGDLNNTLFWVTDADSTYYANEQSIIFSPTYDLSAMNLPTISFDFACEMDLRDGAVFQFSTDDGVTWETLGDYDNTEGTSGKSWYNTLGVNGDPGNIDDLANIGGFNEMAYGWNLFGGKVGDDDERDVKWRTAAHKLDVDAITDEERSHIRFRFSLGATAGEKDGLGGFAFDNVKFYDREKVTIIEQFSSLELESSRDADNTIYELLGSDLRSDALLINYYTALVEDPDILNKRNANDPGARAAYYGISTVPTSVLSGDIQEADEFSTDAQLSTMGWNVNKFNEISLDEAFFDISNVGLEGTSQDITVASADFTSKVDLPEDTEISFRFAIVESRIYGQDINSTYGVDTIYNALRKMLPAAGGFTYVGSVDSGQVNFGIDLETTKWNISSVYNADELKVIVFVQLDTEINSDAGLYKGAILQASEVVVGDKELPTPSTITGNESLSREFNVYPNPSDEAFEIEINQSVSDDMRWILYDQSGREVNAGVIEKESSKTTVSSELLPSGIYMLHVFNDLTEWQPKRVIVVH